MLRDELKEVIKMGVCEISELYFENINALMIAWYKLCRDGFKYRNITYRGRELKIVYDITLDDEGEVIEETDFITIRKYLEEQISSINDMFKDGE